jgi:glutathione S-transferase
MQLILYYSPGACSLAAHITLRESGLAFELKPVLIAKGEHRTSEFLAINPQGRVPVLAVDGVPVTELSGILTWIGQQATDLFPPSGTLAAARCSQWLGWLTSAVHISFALIWRPERFTDEPGIHGALRARGLASVAAQFSEIEHALTASPYALGEYYSVVDANILPFYRWGNRVGFEMRAEFPHWTAHTERLLQRDSVREAVAHEQIDLWQAADAPFANGGGRKIMTSARLKSFGQAWADGDVDALAAMMTPDAVYSASVGPEPGETFIGSEAIRAGFGKAIGHDAGGTRVAGPAWILGNIGFGVWEFHFPSTTGGTARIVRGIDYFEFDGERISRKDAYRKCVD